MTFKSTNRGGIRSKEHFSWDALSSKYDSVDKGNVNNQILHSIYQWGSSYHWVDLSPYKLSQGVLQGVQRLAKEQKEKESVAFAPLHHSTFDINWLDVLISQLE